MRVLTQHDIGEQERSPLNQIFEAHKLELFFLLLREAFESMFIFVVLILLFLRNVTEGPI